MIKKNKPKYLVFDVDGVMTTGHQIYSKNGKTYKIFGAHDHDGIKILKKSIKIIFITADKIGLDISKKRIVSDMGQKLFLVSELSRFNFIGKFGFENVIYMGDGIHDAKIIKKCLFGICPNNARKEAKDVADYITPSNSAEGAVLDACLKIGKKFFNLKV